MYFLEGIIDRLNNISSFFYSVYLDIFYWISPFDRVAPLFYQLSLLFNTLAWDFYNFNQWANMVADKVANLLTYSNIYSYFSSYFDYAVNAWNWVYNAWSNVVGIIDTWWSSVQYTVQVWIDEAKAWAGVQIDTLENTIASVLAWWNEFQPTIPTINEILAWFADWWGRTLANIISWGALTGTQISGLFDSKIRDWFPFYDDLAALLEDIKLFFVDPLQWLYDRAEEFFERFW